MKEVQGIITHDCTHWKWQHHFSSVSHFWHFTLQKLLSVLILHRKQKPSSVKRGNLRLSHACLNQAALMFCSSGVDWSQDRHQFLLLKGARSETRFQSTDPRYDSATSKTSTFLIINDLKLEDTASYYCALEEHCDKMYLLGCTKTHVQTTKHFLPYNK